MFMIDFAFVRSIKPSSPILISLGRGTCFIKLIIVKAIIIYSYLLHILKIRSIAAIWHNPGNALSRGFNIAGLAMHAIFSMYSHLFMTCLISMKFVYLR